MNISEIFLIIFLTLKNFCRNIFRSVIDIKTYKCTHRYNAYIYNLNETEMDTSMSQGLIFHSLWQDYSYLFSSTSLNAREIFLKKKLRSSAGFIPTSHDAKGAIVKPGTF